MIAAIDPGSTTGLAWTMKKVPIQELHRHVETAEYSTLVPPDAPADHLYEAEIDMADELLDDLLALLPKNDDLTLLIEDFTPRIFNKSRAFLSPVRVSVAILTILQTSRLPFTLDLPGASTMANVSDDRLKALGLWATGSKHERAALKHLVSHLRK